MPLVHCSLRSLRLALRAAAFLPCLQTKTCLLTPPQHGGARSGVGLLRSAQRGSRYGVRRLRRPSQTKNVSAHSSSARRRAIRGWIASLRSARIALWSPPTSSSLADEKRVCSLLLSTAARDPGLDCFRSVNCSLRSLRLALRGRCLPHSLADEKACLLARSSRTAARQPCPARIAHGGARSGVGLLRPIRRGAGEESDCRDVDLGTRNTFGAPL